MNRSQFFAILVVIGVLGALVATRIQLGSENDSATSEASPSSQQTDSATNDDTTSDDATSSETSSDDTANNEEAEVEGADAPPVLDPKPALANLDGWINTDATSLDDFDGQVRVVEFWTFGCFNCRNRISHTQELYAEFQPQGLEIIGVHAPEFERERDPAAVEQATVDLGVTWPVALDTSKTNFRAWQESRRFWPRVYVLDQNGDVRYDHIGEGDYDGLEETVAYLIENGP